MNNYNYVLSYYFYSCMCVSGFIKLVLYHTNRHMRAGKNTYKVTMGLAFSPPSV